MKSGGKDKYFLSKQSKSGALLPGGSYEMTLNITEGFDYKITSGIDSKDKMPIPFEIFEMVADKSQDAGFKKVKKIINTSDGELPIEIRGQKTNIYTIKVFFPPSESEDPSCVAILIEDRKSTKIGF